MYKDVHLLSGHFHLETGAMPLNSYMALLCIRMSVGCLHLLGMPKLSKKTRDKYVWIGYFDNHVKLLARWLKGFGGICFRSLFAGSSGYKQWGRHDQVMKHGLASVTSHQLQQSLYTCRPTCILILFKTSVYKMTKLFQQHFEWLKSATADLEACKSHNVTTFHLT